MALSLGYQGARKVRRLSPGEAVLDLGYGAGFDVCVTAAMMGRGGSVVGLDSSAELLGIVAEGRTAVGGTHVAFRAARRPESSGAQPGEWELLLRRKRFDLLPN